MASASRSGPAARLATRVPASRAVRRRRTAEEYGSGPPVHSISRRRNPTGGWVAKPRIEEFTWEKMAKVLHDGTVSRLRELHLDIRPYTLDRYAWLAPEENELDNPEILAIYAQWMENPMFVTGMNT